MAENGDQDALVVGELVGSGGGATAVNRIPETDAVAGVETGRSRPVRTAGPRNCGGWSWGLGSFRTSQLRLLASSRVPRGWD